MATRAPWSLVRSTLVGGALACAGCVDYDIVNKNDNDEIEDTAVIDVVGLDGGEAPSPACDEEPVDLADAVGIDETCLSEPVIGTLDAQVEWSVTRFRQFGEASEILMAPVVGQLTDDDGDGVISADDTPDIVVISHDPTQRGEPATHGVLRVINGADGNEHLGLDRIVVDETQLFPYRFSNAALGDMDADGEPEIVFLAVILGGPPDTSDPGGGSDTAPVTSDSGQPIDTDGGPQVEPFPPMAPPPPPNEGGSFCVPMAVAPDGVLRWVAWDALLGCGGHAPVLADLEADGRPEVVVGSLIVDGLNGAVLSFGAAGQGRYLAYPEIGFNSVVGDLDGDGLQEVIAGNTVYDATGLELCNTGDEDGFGAIADLDQDGVGDFVVVGNGHAGIYDASCAAIATWSLSGGGTGGPPTVADFDGDGAPEVGIADAGVYAVYEADGTLLWSQTVTDASSHATGSSVFDFEGDGRPEVVYGDEVTLWVFDGTNGDVRLQDTHHTSRTLHELPTVVDVDGDGETEIVVVNGGGHYEVRNTGMYVLGSLYGDWLGNREVWNQHAYSITNINDDLTLPAPPSPNWPIHNNFRSGDPHPVSGGSSTDAVPTGALCTLECEDGVLVLDVALGNGGMATMRDGVPLSIYAQRGSQQIWLATDWTTDVLEPGEVSQRFRHRIATSDVAEGVLILAADEYLGTEYVRECDEDNNTLRIEGARCP
ncbi:MAG: VCBS repeat-containing protein [Alphaproteobacteria bacterium]|nr:VCBS repeat-containing protein [Alphaproteobacteria bacterium]